MSLRRVSREDALRQFAEWLAGLGPRAYSVNGKDFRYESPLSAPLMIGSYVNIKATDGGVNSRPT